MHTMVEFFYAYSIEELKKDMSNYVNSGRFEGWDMSSCSFNIVFDPRTDPPQMIYCAHVVMKTGRV